MKQVQQSISARLSSYQRQAKQYANKPVRKKASITKGTLMALVPLVATSVIPNEAEACSFRQTFTLNSNGGTLAGTFYIDLPFNGAGNDFVFRYQNSGGGPVIIAGALGAFNAIQRTAIAFPTYTFPIIPNLSYGAPVTTADFVANTSAPIYSFTSNFASPQAPLSSPDYIAIRSDSKYGFLGFSITGNQVMIFGGINEDDTSFGNSGPVEAGDCSTLPVELTSFKANPQEEVIALEWETATEINNLGFELQRSADGKAFEKIAWVDGHGTTAEQQYYRFIDEKVLSNRVYYYRLMQVDTNGDTEYSEVITAELKGLVQNELGQIYPNPVQQIATLPISLVRDEDVTISVYDTHGRMVKELTQILEEGKHELILDMGDLASGNYYAKVAMETQVDYLKILKVD